MYGYQPIHLACENGDVDIVKILIDNKCDINAFDEYGYQPIHLACENGDVDIVKILIDNKCDINASNKNGYQPIQLANNNGHIDIVQILTDKKCDINVADKITEAMNIHFICGCDHKSFRKSLEDKTFKKGELIGSGMFGKIYKYKISSTNHEIVIKQRKSIDKDTKNVEENINKYSIRIIHPNIIRYFGALTKSNRLCIFMEYIPGGSLKDLIDKSKWIKHSKVIKFSKEILEGLEFIHSQGIIHRDIKPENMLLDHNETLKLIDFGLSKSLHLKSFCESTTKTVTFCGTPNYLAPEIFLGEPYYFPADIWSTGVSVIHMITGKTPYHSLPIPAVMFKIGTSKKIEFTPLEPISETMQSFIDYLLTPEQSERPSAKDLLKHSIFQKLRLP